MVSKDIKYFEWSDIQSEICKDTISRNDLGECIESKLEWVKEDGKEWLESFIKAVYKV